MCTISEQVIGYAKLEKPLNKKYTSDPNVASLEHNAELLSWEHEQIKLIQC